MSCWGDLTPEPEATLVSSRNGVKREASSDTIDGTPEPQAKKPRGSQVLEAAFNEREHDLTYWYPDGSIVVQVVGTLFKLHRSRLATQSAFFRDLFEGAPDEDYECEDGSTRPLYVVRAKGLKLFDFSALLDVIEDTFAITQATPPFAKLAAVARASRILGFAQARSWAVQNLNNLWSSDVGHVHTQPSPDALDALQLSREADILGIRKRALYELLRLPEFGQVEGESQLSVEDYKVLTRAREGCVADWTDMLMSFPDKHERCRTSAARPSPCAFSSSITRKWCDWVKKNQLLRFTSDPIGGYVELLRLLPQAVTTEEKWCGTCVESWVPRFVQRQEHLWSQLDAWLELE